MKKLASILLSASMLLSSLSAFAAEQYKTGFTDVAGTEYFAGSANALHSLNILSGYEDGSFGAEKSVTRAEMAAIICNMLNKSEDAAAAKGSVSFDDVPGWHWASGYIHTANAAEIIKGDGDGNFRPDDSVKYEEAVKMVVCAANLGNNLVFDENDWSAPYIAIASENGITENIENTKGQPSSRGDVAVMVFNSIQKVLAVPSPSVKAGAYSTSQNVALKTDISNIPIYYTTDGTNPTALSKEYTDEILIDKNTILKAAAIIPNVLNSEIMKADYLISSSYGGIGNISTGSSGNKGSSGSSSSGSTSSARYTLSFAEVSNGSVDNTKAGKYERNDKIKINATPNAGYNFVEWHSSNGGKFSDSKKASTTFTMPGNSVTLTAVFAPADDTQTFSPDLLNVEDCDILNESKPYISFYDNDSNSVKYMLSEDFKLFVNDTEITVNANNLDKYLYNTEHEIKLVDTDSEERAADGLYDKIYLSFYATAKVGIANPQSKSITFDNAYNNGGVNKLILDETQRDLEYDILLNGEKITLSDLQYGDILSIAFDVNEDLSLSDFYEIYVSRDNMEGIYEGTDDENETVRVNGKDYKLLNYYEKELLTLNKMHLFRLDVFGKIFDFEITEAPENYAVIDGYEKTEDGDYYIATLYTAKGSIENLAVVPADVSDANIDYYNESIKDIVYDASGNKNPIAERAVTYEVSGGKITELKKSNRERYAQNDLFFTSGARLGSIKMSNRTIVLDATDGNINLFAITDVSAFTDNAEYTAYSYGERYTDGTYPFVIVTKAALPLTEKKDETESDEKLGIIESYFLYMDGNYADTNIYTTDRTLLSTKIATDRISLNSSDISERVYSGGQKTDIQNRVVKYKTSSLSGRITSLEFVDFDNSVQEQSYDFEANTLGSIKIGADTVIIDAVRYIVDNTYYNLDIAKISDFENDGKYSAFAFGSKNADGEYPFVIVTASTISLTDKETGKQIGIIEDCSDTGTVQIYTSKGELITPETDATALSISKEDIISRIYDSGNKTDIQRRVAEYEISDEKLVYLAFLDTQASAINESYDKTSRSIGDIKMHEKTRVIDAIEYCNYADSTYKDLDVCTIAAFSDDVYYTAFAYGQPNDNGEYAYVLVTDVPDYDYNTNFAVVAMLPKKDPDNSEDIYLLETLYNGEEQTLTVNNDAVINSLESIDSLQRGDVIIFTTDRNGFIRQIDVLVKASELGIDSDYDTVSNNALKPTVNLTVPENALNWTGTWTYAEDTDAVDHSKDVTRLLYGPVVEKHSNYFKLGSVAEAVDMSVNDSRGVLTKYTGLYTDKAKDNGNGGAIDVDLTDATNVYVFDYSNSNPRTQLYAGTKGNIFAAAIAPSLLYNNRDFIPWSNDGVKNSANFALVKTVDGTAADVFIILSK